MNVPEIRPLDPGDYAFVASVVDEWWGGRPVRALLPRLFFEHFNTTSFAVGPADALTAFLVGFVSPTHPRVGYIHFVGVAPARRAQGLGRQLYEKFFATIGALGCDVVRCITSPVNTGSIAFHRRMGFAILEGTGEVDGVPVTLDYAGQGQHRVLFERPLAPRAVLLTPPAAD